MKTRSFMRLSSVIFSSLLLFSTFCQAKVVTDVVGREVDIPEKVERILLGEGRLFYALALLEGDKPFSRIVGWQGDFRKLDAQTYSVYRKKFPEIDNIPLIGETTSESVSAEKVLTLQPDIAIFGLSGHGPGRNSELVNQLQKAGVPVIFVDFRSYPLKNTLPSIKLLGEALQRQKEAEAYITFYQQQLKRITEVVTTIPEDKRRSVFIELRPGSREGCCSTAGNGNMGDFIDLSGANNIAKPLLPATIGAVNLEKILAVDPNIYILTGGSTPDAKMPGVKLGALVTEQENRDSVLPLLARTGIKELTAVKEGHVYALWHNFYNSPLNILAIQSIAKWAYPQQFADLDPKQTMTAIYDQFLAIQPSGTYWSDKINLPTK